MFGMVKVIMNFEVEDWDKWHAAFLANSKMREENDIKEIYVGHELENKNKEFNDFYKKNLLLKFY